MAARQQQGPRGAFAEAGGEQRRPADLRGDDRFDLLGVEDEQFGERHPAAGFEVGVGQPHDDAVVGGGGLLVDAVTLAQPASDRQRERSMDAQAVGECRMIRQSPSSSRNRSTTKVVSVGTVPVACR